MHINNPKIADSYKNKQKEEVQSIQDLLIERHKTEIDASQTIFIHHLYVSIRDYRHVYMTRGRGAY